MSRQTCNLQSIVVFFVCGAVVFLGSGITVFGDDVLKTKSPSGFQTPPLYENCAKL